MTCREKLKLKNPDCTENQLSNLTRSYCPWEMGIDYPPEKVCRNSRCGECWDTEIPGIETIKKENKNMANVINVTGKMTKDEMIKEIEFARNHIQEMENRIKNLERYKQYEDMADELKAVHTALMNSGFTNEQAFEMLKTTIQVVAPSALRGMGV